MWQEYFYGMDAVPVTQPIVLKHWKKHKALTPTSGLASTFLHPPPDSWWKGHCSVYASLPMPVTGVRVLVRCCRRVHLRAVCLQPFSSSGLWAAVDIRAYCCITCRIGRGTGCLPSRRPLIQLVSLDFIGSFHCGLTEMSRYCVFTLYFLMSDLMPNVIDAQQEHTVFI